MRQRFVGGAAWTGISRLLASAVSLGVTVVLARLLAPEDYGLLAMATVFTGLLEQAQDFGAAQALVQKEEVTVANQRAAFTLALLVSTAFCAALALAAPLLAALYDDERVVPVLRVIAVAFPIGAFAVVPRALLRRELLVKGESFVNVAATVLESAAMLVLAWWGFGVWALVAGRLASALASAVGLAIVRPWHPGLGLPTGESRGMLRFGGGVTLSTLLWYGYSNADFFIVGRVLGSAALGAYSMAWKLAKMPWDRLWYSLNPLILPLYSRSRDRIGELGRVLLRLTRYTALLTAPAVAGLGAVADDVVLTFLGEKWRPMVGPLRWLCAYGVVRASLVLLPPVLLAVGRIRQEVAFNALCCLVLPLAFVVGVRYGPSGVGAAWAFVYTGLALVYLVPRATDAAQVPLRRYLASLVRPQAATLAMVVAVIAVGIPFSEPGPWRLGARVLTGVLVYAAAVHALEGSLVGEARRFYADLREGMRA